MMDRVTRWLWRHLDRRFDALQQEIRTMSETTDTAFAELTALAQKQAEDSAKLKADVTTLLTTVTNTGPLNTSQQAAVDNIKALMGRADSDTTDTDAAVAGATPPPGPTSTP